MELKEQELFFQSIFEAAPVALIVTNSSGRIIHINQFAVKLFNYQKKDLEGENLELLLKDNTAQNPLQNWNSYFSNPDSFPPETEKIVLAKTESGTEFPVEIKITPMTGDQNHTLLFTLTDASEQVKATEHLRLIVESALNSMILTDAEGKILVVNRQTEYLFGYDTNELTGKKIEILVPQRVRNEHPQHREQFYAHPKARPMGAGRDLYAVKKDGTEFPVEIGLNPIEKNGAKYVLASVIDITKRKKDEEALQLYARQIEEKNKELEQFAHVASHDLREPLNSIISLTDLLVKRKSDQLDPDGAKMLGYIDKSALRMKELITDLLDYAQLGSRKELVLTDLNEMLETVLLDLNSSVQSSGAIITKSKLPVLKVYAMEFRLLLQNLLSNAIKYRLPDVPPEITISSRQVRKGWEFSIADNGIGIPEAQKEKIFDLFHRVHGRSEYEGTGIGLAHCRKIIDLHNGKIWVETNLGKGSTFFFSIPGNLS